MWWYSLASRELRQEDPECKGSLDCVKKPLEIRRGATVNYAAVSTRLLISLILVLFSKYPGVGGFTGNLFTVF